MHTTHELRYSEYGSRQVIMKKNEPKKCQDDQLNVSRTLAILTILFGTIIIKIKNNDYN